MTLFIALCAMAAAASWLLAARIIYGRVRQRGIDDLAAQRSLYDDTLRYEDPVGEWEAHHQYDAVMEALLFAMLWPLTLAAFCIRWCITSSPPLSAHELKAERDALQAEVNETNRRLRALGIDL
ncbi:hypothetical protein DEJ49_33255 [Streptomyces venezuelae]|uniref:Uncharacterized protein n=1 Tax=Streptomyces venezuelae TaxID=54571 RepID=A0A5P2CWG5_STRVZ|nr:hypothetical protein [Streptomyces venezuelae]QES45209.1 hypothetical protein DEJ49_33255 [Streptomyces venezuelae]